MPAMNRIPTTKRSSSTQSLSSATAHPHCKVGRVPTKNVHNAQHLIKNLEARLGRNQFQIMVQHNAYSIKPYDSQVDMDKVLQEIAGY
ncbi:hypothetical protein GGTG_03574 [Gaeumannomyces tritici R3-111a-1]|uniref:Uncharacterized protein n=1 Tax=Gaeumannomyces tritici (strain R3-111a-1) TaxID=644352 RepID=J3NQL8_GAET3|nr:hypothetical protein GGTG_03574 [Gaeumannomyces tritici R3-111a-1]EJT78474.1 hypothetical protein GGTG_03574 [Gaeumannomyces tritici R3-111a-1]